jgi:quercetin dioxygenase-like cupin family protein
MTTMPRPINEPSVLDSSIVQAIALGISPVELSGGQRARMLERLLDRVSEEPREQTIRADSLEWQQAGPNVWSKVLRKDQDSNVQMVLFRIAPGGVVPAHAQAHEEECLVLEGEIFIGRHRVGRGDLHIAQPGASDRHIVTHTGAVVLIRSQMSR